jgi:S-methylmethionine-dependent homocysteine/selenocysteine methylase
VVHTYLSKKIIINCPHPHRIPSILQDRKHKNTRKNTAAHPHPTISAKTNKNKPTKT